MSISDKQDDSNEAGKLLKHLTEGLHHWKKRWLFHLLHYFIASYALLCMWTKFGANEKSFDWSFWANKNFDCLHSLVTLRKGEGYETTNNW